MSMVGELTYEERMTIAEALYEAERNVKPLPKITIFFLSFRQRRNSLVVMGSL